MTYPVLLPAIVLDGTQTIRLNEGGVAQTLSMLNPATGLAIPFDTEVTFYLRGDGATDDLLRAVRETLDTHTGTNTYSVSISRNIDGTTLPSAVTISRATGASTFSIQWGSSALDEALLGFRNITTTTGTTTTGDISPTGQWIANDIYEEFESEDEVDGFVERTRSGAVFSGRRGGPYDVRRLSMRFQVAQRTHLKEVPTISSVVDTGRAFGGCWEKLTRGRPFELHFATLASGTTLNALSSTTRQGCFNSTGTSWRLDSGSIEAFRPERLAPGVGLYSWSLRMLGNVS
jgi:hypothetical protein